MKKFDIDSIGIEFKNLVSGPAPVGRILNYIYICGDSILKHKNGHRETNLKHNIGYAWTTELMIGLDLVCLGANNGDGTFKLKLTNKGKKIYSLLKGKTINFDEGSNKNSIKTVRKQINNCHPELYEEYKKAFINSLPFQILKEFLDEYGYFYTDRTVFIDDYFETTMNMYDKNPAPYNRESRLPTGRNRVPSLLQLCSLFELLKDEDSQLLFNKNTIQSLTISVEDREFTPDELNVAAEADEELIEGLNIENLAKKYGIDGNQLISAIVRNSRLQTMFKHNLMVSQNSQCLICQLKNKNLLVASHIKPAAESNVFEKVDYNNGLLLCCNHDKLFDRHLITFHFLDGQIEISKTLSEEDIKTLGLNKNYKLPADIMTDERKKYLMEHNTTFNNEESKR